MEVILVLKHSTLLSEECNVQRKNAKLKIRSKTKQVNYQTADLLVVLSGEYQMIKTIMKKILVFLLVLADASLLSVKQAESREGT